MSTETTCVDFQSYLHSTNYSKTLTMNFGKSIAPIFVFVMPPWVILDVVCVSIMLSLSLSVLFYN